MFIDLYRSKEFENNSVVKYKQAGTFVLIGTTNRFSTSTRLNGGWVYTDKENPRLGTKSPPLGLESDWRHCDTISTMVDVKVLLGCAAFDKIFAVPNYVQDVSPILNARDKEEFPSLNNKGMNYNGLTHVRCLQPHIIQMLENEYDISGDQMADVYQETLTRFVVDTVGKLITVLSHKISLE